MMNTSQLPEILHSEWQGIRALSAQNIKGVSIDSRHTQAGDLFVAIKGERFDGHDFIKSLDPDVVCGAIVSKAVECNVPYIQVKDTRLALGQLAQSWLAQYSLKRIAITGSSGKTTVKEMLATILSTSGPTVATLGNFNNEIGVPLTLFKVNDSYQYGVFELGANHLGEIAYTVDLIQPDVALINNVQPAHLEGFGSIEGVAGAKSEIYEGLVKDGCAVINLDERFSSQWLEQNRNRKVLTFSCKNKQADIVAENIYCNEQGFYQFDICAEAFCERFSVKLTMLGKHNIANVLAAVTIALQLGLKSEQIQRGLNQVQVVAGRLQVYQLKHGVTIIDDSYNANVGSVKAAIDVLSERQGRKILVLGELGELGGDVVILHEEISGYALHKGIEQLYAITPYAESLKKGYPAVQVFNTQSELLASLEKEIITGDQILIKGSRTAKMDLIVAALLEQTESLAISSAQGKKQ